MRSQISDNTYRLCQLILVTSGAFALQAHAQTPVGASPAVQTSATTLATTATNPHASNASKPAETKISEESIKRARLFGMNAEVLKGVVYFCKVDASVGTRLKTKKCVDEDSFNAVYERNQYQHDLLKASSGSCVGGICGGQH